MYATPAAQYEEAEELYHTVLVIEEERQPPDWSGQVAILSDLAGCLIQRGRYPGGCQGKGWSLQDNNRLPSCGFSCVSELPMYQMCLGNRNGINHYVLLCHQIEIVVKVELEVE